jgi:hypothetical protein
MGAPAAVSAWVPAFVERLRELGWREGFNVSIKYRWAEGQFERLAGFADEFVRQGVAIIVAEGTVTTLAAKKATLSPTEYGRLLAEETKKWAKVVKFAGIKPE